MRLSFVSECKKQTGALNAKLRRLANLRDLRRIPNVPSDMERLIVMDAQSHVSSSERKIAPGTAGVVQRIGSDEQPLPDLRVVKPLDDEPCSIPQY